MARAELSVGWRLRPGKEAGKATKTTSCALGATNFQWVNGCGTKIASIYWRPLAASKIHVAHGEGPRCTYGAYG